MLKKLPLPLWTIALPILAWIAYFLPLDSMGSFGTILLVTLLIGSVLSAVHHAEVVAHKVGEPFGTLILALAVTTIEVSLIVSLMLTGGPGTEALARDTVFAAVMIILTGMVGICLLAGGVKFKQQRFSLDGVKAALVALAAILTLTLVLPNHTTSVAGPFYNDAQLIFVAIISLILYGTFVLVQTVRHRDFFLPPDNDEKGIEAHAEPPTRTVALSSGLLLLVCLGIVVLLAKTLAPDIENAVISAGAPKMLVGVIIAAVVLLPEGLAAYRAARKNRLQTSLNLALGSALATIGLTIPAVSIVSLVSGMTITLGIDTKSVTLLLLSLFTIMLSLGSGRTNILQGVVLLTIFAAYLFTIVAP